MIDPQSLGFDALPSVPLERRSKLPETSCIYFAIDSNGIIQYIGQTVNLKHRWFSHHKLPCLREMEGVRIAYLETDRELLDSVEKALIEWFKPPLNQSLHSGIKTVPQRRQESVTISLTTDEKAELEKIALQFGCTWGEKPNVSGLMKAIASHRLKIFWDDEIPKPDIKRRQARSAIEKIKQGLDELSDSL